MVLIDEMTHPPPRPFQFLNQAMRQIATAQHLADLVCKGMPKLMFSMDFMGGNVDLTSERTLSSVQLSLLAA